MLRGYAGSFDLALRPLAREQWLSYELSNRLELYGKLDRIDDAGGAVDVIDYKTGRRILDEDELKRDLAAQVYVLAAARAYERPVRAVRFIYLATGTQTSWYPEADDLREIEERLVRLTDEIRATQRFVARPGASCRFCAFALRCPERQQTTLDDLQPVDGLPF
jgi:putative RecB family exonuclease